MKKYLIMLLICVLFSCQIQEKRSKMIYKSDQYTLYNDRVIQGNNTATVLSPTHIRSDYKSSKKDTVVVKDWKLILDTSAKSGYRSGQPIVDALFNLTTEEALKNIEKDSTFRTGAKWGGVWTRDISYSIFLAFAYHEPEIAKISLMKKVKRDRIIQDTGSGGAWPISSDRMIWAIAAWEIYKVTGDLSWLKRVYPIIKNSLDDDYKTLYDPETGLYHGESSFLDWREQTYPRWMNNMDIYVSENLGTNVIHYEANTILSEMAQILNEPCEIYQQRAKSIKEAINEHLWIYRKGFYAQYLYGRPNLSVSLRFEALGEALSVLFDVADHEKSTSIFEKSPVTPFGVTCIYPQIPDIPPYHNNAIWPFVQSYWNIAAAKAGNEEALVHGLSAIYRAGAFFLTNFENMVAETGDFEGTQINSDRMLWSIAGNLAMVNRVFMGISFEKDGIRFSPVIPEVFGGTKLLTGFKFREAILDITVNGFGKNIASVKLDHKPLPDAFLPSAIKGRHSIVIEMDNKSFRGKHINLVPNYFSLPNPVVTQGKNSIKWESVKGAVSYQIYKNGKLFEKTNETEYIIEPVKTAEYKVSAVDSSGWESFTSEPLRVVSEKNIKKVEIENYKTKSALPYRNYSGAGFVESSASLNRIINIPVRVEKAGIYLIDFRYSNGSGPWNTENKCAIRSLYVNKKYTGCLVFPQRGTDLWSDWDFSNSYSVDLIKGINHIKIAFEEWNNNMNVDINRMMLDYLRIVYLGK